MIETLQLKCKQIKRQKFSFLDKTLKWCFKNNQNRIKLILTAFKFSVLNIAGSKPMTNTYTKKTSNMAKSN